MANASGVRAGRAFVELFAEDNKLYRALDQAKARVQQFAAQVGRIGVQAGAAGGLVLAPLGKALNDAVARGSDIKTLADRFNLTTTSVAEMAGAFEVAGATFGDFEGTLDSLGAKLASAADGNDELFRRLHLNARGLINLPLDKQIDHIAEAFSRVVNPIDQANVATELFGSAGRKLLPFLRQGAAGLEKLKTEARAAGAVMNPEDVERSYQAHKALNVVWVEMKNTVVQLGAALLPTTDQTKDLTTQVREAFTAVRSWVTENRGLIVSVAKVALGVTVAGTALVTLSTGLRLVAAPLGLAVSTAKLLTGGFLSLAGAIGPVGLAVGGLTALFLTQTQAGRKLASEIGTGFKNAAATFTEAWGGIVASVRSGDLAGAFKIAGVGIKGIWFGMLIDMGKAFAHFVSENREKMIALAGITGAIGGAKAGARLGPWGLLGGGLLGGAGGAGLADAKLDMLEGFGHMPGLEKKLEEAKKELHELVMLAKGKAAGPKKDGEGPIEADAEQLAWLDHQRALKRHAELKKLGQIELPALFGAQKGVFSGPVTQSLAYGDQTQKRQLDQLVGLNAKAAQIAAKVGMLGGKVFAFK